MTAQEDRGISLSAFGIECGKGVAIGIDLHGIGKLPDIIDPDFLPTGLKAGRGRGIEQRLQEFIGGCGGRLGSRFFGGEFHGERLKTKA